MSEWMGGCVLLESAYLSLKELAIRSPTAVQVGYRLVEWCFTVPSVVSSQYISRQGRQMVTRTEADALYLCVTFPLFLSVCRIFTLLLMKLNRDLCYPLHRKGPASWQKKKAKFLLNHCPFVFEFILPFTSDLPITNNLCTSLEGIA